VFAQEGHVLCSPGLAANKCQAFNDAFAPWSGINILKNIEIVVTDQAGIANEKKKATAKAEALLKFAKTPGDLNRSSILVAEGVFDSKMALVEKDTLLINKVVVFADAPLETSDQLMFFIFGYSEGALQGMGSTVKWWSCDSPILPVSRGSLNFFYGEAGPVGSDTQKSVLNLDNKMRAAQAAKDEKARAEKDDKKN
jgi:hypothetical protein